MAAPVKHIEWKFGVTAAVSGDENAAGSTYLQMKIVIESGNGKTRNLYVEMTLPKFYAFLHELEKAKNGLKLLT